MLFAAVGFAAPATCVAIFVVLARRHLMVWAVFAPKLVFELGVLAVVEACLVIGAVWWSHVMVAAASWGPQQFFIVEASLARAPTDMELTEPDAKPSFSASSQTKRGDSMKSPPSRRARAVRRR